MTTAELAQQWNAPETRITHWCRLALLPARKMGGDWDIAPDARRPWMDGPMMLAWHAGKRSATGLCGDGLSVSETSR